MKYLVLFLLCASAHARDFDLHDREPSHPVPEPASLLVLGSGVVALIAARRRRK